MYDFIGAFAKCATTFSNAKYEWVARRGKYSIYALLSNLVPKVCWVSNSSSVTNLCDCIKDWIFEDRQLKSVPCSRYVEKREKGHTSGSIKAWFNLRFCPSLTQRLQQRHPFEVLQQISRDHWVSASACPTAMYSQVQRCYDLVTKSLLILSVQLRRHLGLRSTALAESQRSRGAPAA